MEQSTLSPSLTSISGPRLAVFNPEAVAADQRPEAPKRQRKAKAKPDRDCPLWQRADGRWCRKIKGRVHYFGTDKDAALEEWARVKDDLLAGRTPRLKTDGLALGVLP